MDHDTTANEPSDDELDEVPCWPCRGRIPFSEHAPDEIGAHLLATCEALDRLDAWYCRRQAALDQYAAMHKN
ncbi:MAG: hypothetical protein M1522_06755 [Actinobacteria bacterium]|nr:hypothetical protein [Actinomycetota bacterium]